MDSLTRKAYISISIIYILIVVSSIVTTMFMAVPNLLSLEEM